MAQEIKLTMDGLLINWLKEPGDQVKADDVIAEFEADKATVEVEAGIAGELLELRVEPGDEVNEGAVIAVIGARGEELAVADPAAAPTPAHPEAAPAPTAANGSAMTADGRIKASPLAKRIAADRGIDLRRVQGSGPGGRIVKADLENWTAPPSLPELPPAPAAAVGQATWGRLPEEDVEVAPLSRMRRAIADGTIKSKSNTPHFYVTIEVDVEPLLALRKSINAALAGRSVKVSVNDMLIKALALSLLEFPNLNSHYYGDRFVRHLRVNIGVAVALPDNGLVNVVCADADKRSLSELARANKAMYERARAGKIKPEDIRGATFTISNMGPYNIKDFSAIIATPEAGILAVSSAQRVPVVLDDGTLGVGTRMNMTLSVDHRVSNGAEGAAFLNHLRGLIEEPLGLLDLDNV
ncbi:MAG: dihydrolipoamide acetyltransferase family protein [Chloroflexi bacterium]|nr:dihydrolipoamide acetyltransferase family protein [Chloroflexota bacterium]MCY3581150.1 dihydrolipoamide acetyltransferase family protein [Chloroflexota bacterium]MCY3715997.1 dihydrolipoamide acetyltransferase family protein [Chloroflexota bacterium]MDE2651171.1 dihydrolipoamide acetyltransferase family protein [Chloroflexota bacterium]